MDEESSSTCHSCLTNCCRSSTGCKRWRHVIAFLSFLGFVNVYALRVNLSVALVAMVNSTSGEEENETDVCPGNHTSAPEFQEGEFPWDSNLQGTILGAFFYGYILTQVPGGWLAEKFGAKYLYGLGVLCTSVLTLVTPIAARTSVPLLLAVRVVEGIGEGVTFPAMHALLAKWAPPLERSKLGAFVYAGAQFGTVVSLPISGLLCNSSFLGGWPSVFYVFGSIGCLWFIAWHFLVYDSPAKHPYISIHEREYIESSIGHREKKAPTTPWLSIFRSVHFWAILVAHVCHNWGFYTLLTTLPTYMKKVLHFDISQNGFLSALPYLIMWLMINISGQFADLLRYNHILSTTAVRKICNTFGFLLAALFLILAGYSGCDPTLAVVYVCLAVGGSGWAGAGFQVNHLDLAPPFAGTLLGLTNMAATVPGFISPKVVGILTEGNHKSVRDQWRTVFFIASGAYLFGAIIFALLASGKEQPWAQRENVPVGEEDDRARLINKEQEDDDDEE